jgi:uncharacterized lipoprotein
MRGRAIWIFIGLLLGGCALSPQVVSLKPTLEVNGQRLLGQGTSVALAVVDARTSPVIGERGGVYEKTASISTQGDVTLELHQTLAQALEGLGFTVVKAGAPADATLTVELESLSYTPRGGTFVTGVETSAEVRAIAKRGSRTFTGRYRSRQTKDVLTAPGAQENETLINAAVSQVLQRMISDAELTGFLARGQ